MDDKNTIMIHGWMINELSLSGNRLLCYALIYQFSQDSRSSFNGSLRYISKWINCSHSTTRNILNQLESEGLIESFKYSDNKNSWTAYKYKRCTKIEHGCSKTEQGCTEIEHMCTKIEHINNTNNNTYNNKEYLFIEGQKIFDLKEWILYNYRPWFEIQCMNNNVVDSEKLIHDFFKEYLNYDFVSKNHFRNTILKVIEKKPKKVAPKKGIDFDSLKDKALKENNDGK